MKKILVTTDGSENAKRALLQAKRFATALDAAILAHNMSMDGIVFSPDEGILQNDIEKTLKSIGYVAKEGMKSTDLEILKIMTEETHF